MRKLPTLSIMAALVILYAEPDIARADIFQWEYINPANPSLGKQPSTTLAPQGAGVNAERGANLAGRNLTKAYLIGADLSPVYEFENYIPSDLTGTNFSQADLTDAGLSNAYLFNANFSQADLTNAYFAFALLAGANFTGAEIRRANFQYTGLSQTQLYSTASYANHDLTGIAVTGTNLAGVNLSGQELTNTDLSFTSLVGATFNDANLTNAKLTATDARTANLSQANLTNANLTGADIRGANVQSAMLTGANMTNLIQPNSHIAGLNLTSAKSLLVRDYDGTSAASPPTGPLPVFVDQQFVMDASSTLHMIFGANTWDSTISFAPGIPVTRGGTLGLNFEPGVHLAGQIGRTIDLFDWTGVTPTGTFTIYSLEEYSWDLSKLYTTGEVTLTSVLGVLPGDFNYSGTVDAADYVAWRKTDGTYIGYSAWRTNFGKLFFAGARANANSNAAVPEPTSIALVVIGTVCYVVLRRGAIGFANALPAGCQRQSAESVWPS